MQIALDTDQTPLLPVGMLLRIPRPAQESPKRAIGSSRVFAKGEAIFAEGSRTTHFYKVLSGAVRTSQLLSDGRRQIDAFHLPGDFFGIESSERHCFSADAIETTTLIGYRRSCLDTPSSEEGGFSGQILPAMILSLERARAHMLLLGRKNAMEKIATFLLRLSARLPDVNRIDLPMSRMDIADHLGLTIETVSRSLTQLEREGVIELPAHRRCIILRNRRALQLLDT